MRKSVTALLVVISLFFTDTAIAQAPSPSSVSYVTPDTPQGTGPHKAIMEADPSLPTHTEYRPKDLNALGSQKLPIIVWGNGACVNVGNRFRHFLTEIASYGFLAIAIGPIGPKEMEAAPQTNPAVRSGGGPAAAPPNANTPPATRSSQLIDAMNWAIAEDGREDSRYFGKLDTSKIAVMGQSCGGVQAIQASSDPRVTATVIWNSGVLPNPSPAMENISKDALTKLQFHWRRSKGRCVPKCR